MESAYNKLASSLYSSGEIGSDILSVLRNYESMKSGPNCSAIVMLNYYSRMGNNITVMSNEINSRNRDLETLNQLKM